MAARIRCAWATTPLSIAYHDAEWGVPVHDDRVLFEFLTLEGAQAGLSWETILKKREAYRDAFADFDPSRVARFTPPAVERLLQNPGIVRNRLKIAGTVRNANAFLGVQREFDSFDAYLWRSSAARRASEPPDFRRVTCRRAPPSPTRSAGICRAPGFTFVGSTICYAFMQAVGLVNDHIVDCYRHNQVLVQAVVSSPIVAGTSGLSALSQYRLPERGARIARRDEREYWRYLSEEQRSEAGCPARQAVLNQRGHSQQAGRLTR